MWTGFTTYPAAPSFGSYNFGAKLILFIFVGFALYPSGNSIFNNGTTKASLFDKNEIYHQPESAYKEKQSIKTSEPTNRRAGLKNMSTAPRKDEILADFVLSARTKRAVVGANAKIWNIYQHEDKFVVPYTIVSNYTDSQIKRIEAAMAEIEAKTCIIFQHIHDQETARFYEGRSYAEISNSPNDGCHSVIGRSEKINPVKLEVRVAEQKTCIVNHIVLHELLHLLGLYHEHQRPDRDNFMTIIREHVEDGRYYNFDKKIDARTLSDLIETNGTDIDDHPNKHRLMGVDQESIMMYKADTFSKKGGLAVIKMNTKKWQNRIGQSKQASELDYLKVNLLYNCPGVNKLLASYNGKTDTSKSVKNSKESKSETRSNKSSNKSTKKSEEHSQEKHVEKTSSSSSGDNETDSDEDRSKAKKRRRRRKHHSSRRSKKHGLSKRRKSKSKRGSKTSRKSHSHRSKTKKKKKVSAHHKLSQARRKIAKKKNEKHASKKSRGRNYGYQDNDLQSNSSEKMEDSPLAAYIVENSKIKSTETQKTSKPDNSTNKFKKTFNGKIPALEQLVSKPDEKRSEEKLKIEAADKEEHRKKIEKDKTVEQKHEHDVENKVVHEQKEVKVDEAANKREKDHSSEQKQENNNERKQEAESQEKEVKTKDKKTLFGGLRLRKKMPLLKFSKRHQRNPTKQDELSDTQMQQEEPSENGDGAEKPT